MMALYDTYVIVALMMDAYMNGLDTSEELHRMNARRKRQSLSTSTIELMVYVDAKLQIDAMRNGFSIINYILGILNIVSIATYIRS